MFVYVFVKDDMILTVVIFSASLVLVGVGINVVWTSPVIMKLKSNNTDINPLGKPITTYQVALITGLVPFGGVVGPLFFTKFCDIIGRKKTLMILSTLMILFEAVLAFSTNIYMYYISRFMIGLCVGVSVAATSIFLSEISQDHNRGTIGCFVGLSYPIGSLYAYIIGPLFSIKIFTLLCTIPNIFNILCFLIFIPESPFYLASKGYKKETMKALGKIRCRNDNVEKEYLKIVQTLENTTDKVEPTWRNILIVKNLRKGFIIAVTLNALQQLSGIGAILSYAGPLFDAAGASLSGNMTAILIGAVKVGAAVAATAIIERTGRKPLLIISTLGGSIPLFLLGLFFHLKNINSPLLDSILWLPIFSALFFIVTYTFGLGIIPQAIMSELFPSNVKSKTASSSASCALILKCVVTTIFPIMNDFLGPTWCLWVFSVFELLGFLFVCFVVPEIKGKTVLEVQELLGR